MITPWPDPDSRDAADEDSGNDPPFGYHPHALPTGRPYPMVGCEILDGKICNETSYNTKSAVSLPEGRRI
jgi:hypothetical protein